MTFLQEFCVNSIILAVVLVGVYKISPAVKKVSSIVELVFWILFSDYGPLENFRRCLLASFKMFVEDVEGQPWQDNVDNLENTSKEHELEEKEFSWEKSKPDWEIHSEHPKEETGPRISQSSGIGRRTTRRRNIANNVG